MSSISSPVSIKEEKLSDDESISELLKQPIPGLSSRRHPLSTIGNVHGLMRGFSKDSGDDDSMINQDSGDDDDGDMLNSERLGNLSQFFLVNRDGEDEETSDEEEEGRHNAHGNRRDDSNMRNQASLRNQLRESTAAGARAKKGLHVKNRIINRGSGTGASNRHMEEEDTIESIDSFTGEPLVGKNIPIDPSSFYYKYYYGCKGSVDIPNPVDSLFTAAKQTSQDTSPRYQQPNPKSKNAVNAPDNRIKAVSSFYGFANTSPQAKQAHMKRKAFVIGAANEVFTPSKQIRGSSRVESIQKDLSTLPNQADSDDSYLKENTSNSFDIMNGFSKPMTSGNGMSYGNRLAVVMKEMETLTPYPSSTYYDSYFQERSEESTAASWPCSSAESSGTTCEADNSDAALSIPQAPTEEGNKLNVEAKYGRMTIEEWESQGENLTEQVSKLLLKIITFRRKKAILVKKLDDIVDQRANELISQEADLKKSLSRFGNKASEMVHELEDFAHPQRTTKPVEQERDTGTIQAMADEPVVVANKISATPEDNSSSTNQEVAQEAVIQPAESANSANTSLSETAPGSSISVEQQEEPVVLDASNKEHAIATGDSQASYAPIDTVTASESEIVGNPDPATKPIEGSSQSAQEAESGNPSPSV